MSEIKYCFLSQKKIIFIGIMHHIERDCFPLFFFFEKKSVENKHYFYKSFPLTNYSFPLTKFFFFFFYVTKHWKIWKTIFIEGIPAKHFVRFSINVF